MCDDERVEMWDEAEEEDPESRIEDLESELNDHESRIYDLESRIDDCRSATDSLQSEIEKIAIGAKAGFELGFNASLFLLPYLFGAVLAMVISWSRNHSILWAMAHSMASWGYVIYFAVSSNGGIP
jgi:hypothetical protein